MTRSVYVLGGAQTDFARNWSREGLTLFELMGDAGVAALEDASLSPEQIDSGHVGNFTGELFSGQGHLGAVLASAIPELAGKPMARHEAACASGSIAILAACAEIEAGRVDTSLVVGVEQMRNVPGKEAADHLGAAAWRGKEGQGATYLWPHMFSELADEVDRRYGLDDAHLRAIARLNFESARRNPLAQTRGWTLGDGHFSDDDEVNPVIEGRMRRHDCGQITDGAAAVVLAGEDVAARWAADRGMRREDVPRIAGWGHRTGKVAMAEKLADSPHEGLLFPHVAEATADARRRAGVESIAGIDLVELHDCFSITEYVLLEHVGLAAPGRAGECVDSGVIAPDGGCPVNPSGGLIGAGHPVGATGVRMLWDAARQVAGRAGDYQVPRARRAQTLNIGGSAATAVSLVVSCGR